MCACSAACPTRRCGASQPHQAHALRSEERSIREIAVAMTFQVTERYAHLAPKKGSTDKLSDARLVHFYGTSTAPDLTNVVRLAEFQSKNSVVALPDLVTGPVFKTGGGR